MKTETKRFIETLEKRRSIYALGKDAEMTKDRLEGMLERLLKTVPSAFHAQSTCLVLLMGAHHDRLWDIVAETLRGTMPNAAEQFPRTEKKLDSFRAGQGTLLFYDDQAITTRMMMENTAYKENFQPWALQSAGMLQYAVWTALAEDGIGASLQHYNPLIDQKVQREWELPKEWLLLAQMPFGKALAPAEPKEKLPTEKRLRSPQ